MISVVVVLSPNGLLIVESPLEQYTCTVRLNFGKFLIYAKNHFKYTTTYRYLNSSLIMRANLHLLYLEVLPLPNKLLQKAKQVVAQYVLPGLRGSVDKVILELPLTHILDMLTGSIG